MTITNPLQNNKFDKNKAFCVLYSSLLQNKI